MADKPPYTFRTEPVNGDRRSIGDLVEGTGIFFDFEAAIADELIHERLEKGPQSGYHFLFIEKEGAVVGYTCFGMIPCTVLRYDLYWIVVAKEEQHQGIGTLLFNATVELIRSMGGKRLFIETSSRPDYAATRAFYIRCGCREEAVIADFYDDGDSKILYSKSIELD